MKCPYRKSDMTPCVIIDGPICYAADSQDRPICVGCERSPEKTGIPPSPDFAAELARYKMENCR